MDVSAYIEDVYREVRRRGPGEAKFHQVATEVLSSLRPVLERHPE